ncbi:Ig-like domain-containing protein [Rubellicoccus peritrichatus]|uniref:Tandem-95 repeat protein n=1 Tax=Rubellicoccus peritrichatus TaxID=3080537 RepID=A0AAQ3LAH9_9BACT|nr:Ig-like domain-containing protein [Puniceicoccus sp. CR14]WOO40974.1 tandem-95 repeat protein [Puniceicoccus sp. CR14]
MNKKISAIIASFRMRSCIQRTNWSLSVVALRQWSILLPLLLLSAFQTKELAGGTFESVDIGTNGAPNGYWRFTPNAYDINPTEDFAVMLFFHGNGLGGNGTTDLSVLQNYALNGGINTPSKSFHQYFDTNEVLIFTPQSTGDGWGQAMVREFLDYVVSEYRVDRSRIYMTGLSGGAGGIHSFINNDPDAVEVTAFFTTATVGTVEEPAAAFVGTLCPYMIINNHGDSYGGIGAATSIASRIAGHIAGTPPAALRDAYPGDGVSGDYTASFDVNTGWTWTPGLVTTQTGNPIVTIYPGSHHNSWNTAYTTQGNFDWLLSHVKPVTIINAPAGDIISPKGASITFSGSSTAPDGTPIPGSSIYWNSSIDGDLGTGSSITVNNLSYGIHRIRCMGVDSDNYGGPTSITVTVPYDQSFTANIDFGHLDTTATGWNNFDDQTNGIIQDIQGTNNESTSVRIEIQTPFAGRGTNGVDSTVLYPALVQKDHFYTTSTSPRGELLIQGLNPGQSYDFTFFGSRNQGGSSNLITRYTLGSQYVTLETRQNTDQTASINGYIADSSGKVILEVERDQSVSSSTKAYLSSLVITTQGAGGGTGNIAPVANNDAATTDEGVAVTVDVLSNDSDFDGGPNPLSILTFSSTANGGIANVNETLVYTPNAGFSGTETFDYTITDGEDSATATVTITVNGAPPPNIAPVAVNDTAITDEDVAINIAVLANDSDADGGPSALSISIVTTPTNGTAAIQGSEITYTPVAGYFGTDSFNYTITDGEDSATATVNVTINEVVAPPIGGTLFSQDFEGSTTVGDYVSTTPDSGQFDDISAEASAGTWSIANGQLQITRLGSSNDAGLSRVNDALLDDPDLLKFSMELVISNVPSTWSELLVIELGDWSGVADYGSGGNVSYLFERMQIKGDDTGEYKILIDGQASSVITADGSVKQLNWYINNGASTTSYTGLESVNPILHNLAAGTADVWMDDVLVLSAIPVGSAAAINDFRIRLSSNVAYTVGFESIAVSDTLDEATNVAPTPVDDTILTDEGQLVAIDALVNDTDPDGGPSALTLISVDSASYGLAVVNGNQIDYTPNPGFYGTDSFNYTVSDGDATASALITVTVNDTSTAGNLSSANLSGINIGQGLGSSRILAGGEWELNALGTGTSGTLDASYGELETVDGDFSVVVKVQDLGPYGIASVAGLTVRESTAADSVMLQFGINADSSYYQANRTSTGANASTSTPTGTASLPNGWLMIERVGDTLSLATSTDGNSYSVIDTVILAGLANSLQVGLFAHSGDNTDYARVLVSDYAVEAAYAVFLQDFSASTLLADYVSATPGDAIFDDISAESAGGNWSIVNGTLSIDRTGASAGGTNDAGFSRITNVIGDPDLLKVSFDLSLNNIPETWSELMHFELGAWSVVGDYGSGGNLSYLYDRMSIAGSNIGNFRLRINGINSAVFSADGSTYTVTWCMNRSAASVNYIGPDASTYSLAAGTCDLWLGTTAVLTGVNSGNYSGNTVEDFRVRIPSAFDLNITFDNILIEDQF